MYKYRTYPRVLVILVTPAVTCQRARKSVLCRITGGVGGDSELRQQRPHAGWVGYIFIYLHNAHGDVVERRDEQGTSLKRYSYDAFGNEQSREPLDSNPFRYCGEYYDKEAAGYYLRARSYEPETGRFTGEDTHWNTRNMVYGDNPVQWHNIPDDRKDPLGLNAYTYLPDNNAVMQGGNKYVYCVNDPVKYMDKNGRFISTVIGAISGGLIGGVSSVVQGNAFWKGALTGAISGAIAGAGVDLTIASGGTLAFLVPLLGGAGSAIGNLLGQILNGKTLKNADYISTLVSGTLGAVFNMGAHGLTLLGNQAFGSVLQGSNILERMVSMLTTSTTPERFLSTWFAMFFTGMPQATAEYIIDRRRNTKQLEYQNSG